MGYMCKCCEDNNSNDKSHVLKINIRKHKYKNNYNYIQNNYINNYKNYNINNNYNNNNNNINRKLEPNNKNEKKMRYYNYLSISKDFLIHECKIPEDKLDRSGDCTGGWREDDKNGPPGYLKDYIPPKGWTGVGLNVINLYDEGDNTWLGRKKEDGEWYICYHGTKTKESINGIIINNFMPGPRQAFEESDNENSLNNSYESLVGSGIYFAKDIDVAKLYTEIINYKDYKLRVVFMCRINPELVKICNNDKYYVVSGKHVNKEVKPYRVLFHFE